MYSCCHLKPGHARKQLGSVLHSVVATLMIARAVRSGVVFEDSKQVILGVWEGWGGEGERVGVDERRMGIGIAVCVHDYVI